jgi:PD-(D/E)XK nuclease superfamily protein
MLNDGMAKDRRTWTDDQLRHAVETSHSWRGVLRALGFKPTSTGSMRVAQRRAAHLGLDISHFRGKRRWTDEQLTKAVKSAASWREVGDRLGLITDTGTTKTLLKGHAARLGLDTGHLTRPSNEPIEQFQSVNALRYAPEHLRRAAPSLAAAWFALRGCTSSLPMEPEVYDLLVESPDGLQRVQVKSTTCKSADTWMVKVGHGSGGKRNTIGVIPYDHEAIDLFFIVDGDLQLYLIPSAVLGGRIRINLNAYGAYRVGDASSLLGPSMN